MNTVTKKWNTATLNSAIDVVKEPWYPSDEDTNYIGLEHINQNELSLNGIGRSVSLESNKSRFSAGDILFGKLRPYFRKVIKVDFEGVCSTDILVLRAKEGFDQDFIFYFVANPVFISRSTGASTGTRMPRADWKYLGETKWAFPELPEQEAVAGVLKSLDKKIELLRKQNETLEEMARAIFHEWFVEFNFPDKNGKPYKASGGKMVQSELGEIPEGWTVGSIGDIVDIFDNVRLPLSASQRSKRQGEYPYYGATSVMDYIDDYLFDGEYLLLGEDGSVVDLNGFPILQYVYGKFWVNNHAHVLRGKPPYSTPLIYLLFRNTKVADIVTGAVQLKINQGNLLAKKVVIAESQIVAKANDLLEHSFTKRRANENQITYLADIRDTLLPKLMSGEVRVNI